MITNDRAPSATGSPEGPPAEGGHRAHVRSVDFPNGTILGFLGECLCGWKGHMQYMAADAATDVLGHIVALEAS